ncbi:hypothetical protein [Streptomyces anulatus]|uniref:hypothetical protein n=1 Tax=Streptomyces anulatus TaxID=1892 RepID=UPI001C272E64|nr:hypothetical protein [Streptomyces anulatus]
MTGAPAEALGSTEPSSALCQAVRAEARQQAAEALYDLDTHGPVDADHAWDRNGWWIPSSYPAHAVRQAQQFLSTRCRVEVLWFGPGGQLDEPVRIRVDVTGVRPRSTGPTDAPWLEVWDGRSAFGLFLSDVGLVERADPGADLTPVWPAAIPPEQAGARLAPPAESATPQTAQGDRPLPTLDELSLLTNRFLHLAGHRLGEGGRRSTRPRTPLTSVSRRPWRPSTPGS